MERRDPYAAPSKRAPIVQPTEVTTYPFNGTVKQVLAWVYEELDLELDEDVCYERALAALALEEQGKNRRSLVTELESIIVSHELDLELDEEPEPMAVDVPGPDTWDDAHDASQANDEPTPEDIADVTIDHGAIA